jgi:N-glycosylase/DNA lyase
MASVDERFYRDVVRAGYRAAYLLALARLVRDRAVDLEPLGRAGEGSVSDDEAYAQLIALPGVGPYAAAHVLMVLGRHSRLVLDSWTRPTYARLVGKKAVSDEAIRRRFRRFGPYAGLAFWLLLTRDWVADDEPPPT